ncbi:hypothetical protein BD310DRAFT_579290 [Dichomitus squalens]|uniref:Uncharacterized protein n=1 Tax=Dichomitus squalens TaxID=114155 RepID=A0A4Q9Q7N1_9APHY|nr:hypothetical protein BD310DRAFT_579290 [Dichomitus squalens]
MGDKLADMSSAEPSFAHPPTRTIEPRVKRKKCILLIATLLLRCLSCLEPFMTRSLAAWSDGGARGARGRKSR